MPRPTAKSDFISAQREKFEQGYTPLTDSRLRDLIETARTTGDDLVTIEFFRARNEVPVEGVRLHGMRGPLSCADTKIVKLDTCIYRGQWRVADLLLWIKSAKYGTHVYG